LRSVCLSFCLSVHSCISRTAGPNIVKFCARVTFGYGSVLLWRKYNMLYALPVLWMTCFRVMEQMGQNQRCRVCFVHFARWRQRGEICRLPLRRALWFCSVRISDFSRSRNCNFTILCCINCKFHEMFLCN